MDGLGIAGLDGFHHMAIVTPDIRETMRSLGAVFGLSWTEPWTGRIPIEADGQLSSPEVTFTNSKQGPPHIELIQAIPGTVWVPGVGLHHIGFWADDVATQANDLLARGFSIEVIGQGSQFAYLRTPEGFRFELVDAAARPDFARWIAGGTL